MFKSWIGGLTGSIQARVEHEVNAHLKTNEAVRAARDPFLLCFLRRELSSYKFFDFLSRYALFAVLCAVNQYLWTKYAPTNFFEWLPTEESENFTKDVAIYLAATQVALIAIVAVPVGLITYIGQRDDSTREIELYYRESLAHEVFASSVALLVVLTVQFFWPLQALLHRFTPVPAFGVELTWIHVGWLVVNLFVVAHFIRVSLNYVDPRARQSIRRGYIANHVLPIHLRAQLQRYLYLNTFSTVLPDRHRGGFHDPVILFGSASKMDDARSELVNTFRSATVLRDLHTHILGLALRRWLARSEVTAQQRKGHGGYSAPYMGFLPDFDRPMHGRTAWCLSDRSAGLLWYEKLLIRAAFSLRRFSETDVTQISPTDLLEDLIGHAIAAIDRSANSSFDRAMDEVIDFHGFLLDAYTSIGEDGQPYSYAEVPGLFATPHQEWTRPYYRLSQKAVSKIPEDTSFAEGVAYLPFHLLYSRPNKLARGVAAELLNFSNYFVHRLENWLTERRRARADNSTTSEAAPDLAGSDVRAYAAVIRKFIGAWRDTLRMADSLLRWPAPRDSDPESRWRQLGDSWSFIETHLFNSSYLLGAAVRNDDSQGAAAYLDTLVKWPSYLPINMRRDVMFDDDAMLSPEIVEMSWPDASNRTQLAAAWPNQQFDPSDVAAQLLVIEHADTLLIAASIFITWCLRDGNGAGLAGNVARKILARQSDFQESGHAAGDMPDPPNFHELMLQVLRIVTDGAHFVGGGYGARLDHMVQRLDSLTEREVVSGEVYSPGTMFGRDGLHEAFLSVLLARISVQEREDNVATAPPFSINLTKLPDAQASSFKVAATLSKLLEGLGIANATERFAPGVHAINPAQDVEAAITRLKQVLGEARTSLEAAREQWLRDAPVSESRLREIGKAIQETVAEKLENDLILSATLEFVGESAEPAEVEERYITGQIKGQLVDAPLEPQSSVFDDAIAQQVRGIIVAWIWTLFFRQPRDLADAGVPITSLAFWAQAVRQAQTVGPRPFALLSVNDFSAVYRALLSVRSRDTGALRFHRQDPGGGKASKGYRFSVDNIDVYTANTPPGTLIIASEQKLASLVLRNLPGADVPFDVAFIPQGLPHGEALKIQWTLRAIWTDTRIVTLRAEEPVKTADEPSVAPEVPVTPQQP